MRLEFYPDSSARNPVLPSPFSFALPQAATMCLAPVLWGLLSWLPATCRQHGSSPGCTH